MSKDHFIIVVYYFGSAELTGSRRWREMAQLLREHGKVTVVCADGDRGQWDDIKIVHLPDRGALDAPSVFAGRSRDRALTQWVRRVVSSFLFWPDRQKAWSRRAVGWLGSLLDTQTRNIVITSGPIFSVHSEMQRWVVRNPGRVHWVMDFRDLWTNEIAPGLQRRMPSFLTTLERPIEQHCHDTADLVTAIGKGIARLLGNDFGSRPKVLYNGYMKIEESPPIETSEPISIRYLGTIIPGLRSPQLLFQAAMELRLTTKAVRFEFWCNDPGRVLREAAAVGVAGLVNCNAPVSQEEARRLANTAGANVILNALVPEADQVVTGKVFELIAAGRPILAVTGQGSELWNILESCGSKHSIWNLETACESLQALLEKNLSSPADPEGRFSRKHAVETLIGAIAPQ